MMRLLLVAWIILSFGTPCLAGTTGSISGSVKDSTGAVIPGAFVEITNTSQGIQSKSVTDAGGNFAFQSLPVGRYDLRASAPGFSVVQQVGLMVNADSVFRADVVLHVAERNEKVEVSATTLQVDIDNTQVGDVISSKAITAVALNGRSFTDLLSLQPGVTPITTQQPNSIVMAGASVAIAPSGELNPGNESISGQREDANGYIVNGGDVKEMMNGGTSIVPNLDSISEFRVLTSNFDAEYGNYSGGVVNVVTKSGTNQVHGSGFEFLRNTALDARNFFSPEKGFFRQNQFGGTAGGPISRDKVFFFADYQGTRMNQSVDTGLIPVPTVPNRTGDFSGQAGSLTGKVSGPFLANLLSQKLGYAVSANESYFTPGCSTNTQCVFTTQSFPSTHGLSRQNICCNSFLCRILGLRIFPLPLRASCCGMTKPDSDLTRTTNSGACSPPIISSTITRSTIRTLRDREALMFPASTPKTLGGLNL